MANQNEDREIWVRKFNEDSAQKFRDQVLSWIERCGEEVLIPVYIDSYGGYVDSLAKMIETMDSVPNRFATIASGKAMSCGAVLLSHGDLRWCGPYSRVMIHNISGVTYGDAYDKKQSADETMRMQEVFMGLMANNCGMTFEELEDKIKASTSSKEIWLDPQQSVDFGIVDRIGCPMFTSQIQLYATPQPKKPRLTDDEKGVKRKKKITKQPKVRSNTNGRRKSRK